MDSVQRRNQEVKKLRFIPFIDKTRAVDFSTSTTLARILDTEFKISPAPPQFTVKSLLDALGEALENENVIVVGVTNKYYLKLKKALAMVFKAEMYENLDIKRQVTAQDSSVHELQYKFINGSMVFKSDDGMYSGYGLATEPHKIIVLPLGEGKYESMIPKMKDYVLGIVQTYNETEVLEQSRKQSRKYASVFSVMALLSVIAGLGVALFEVLTG